MDTPSSSADPTTGIIIELSNGAEAMREFYYSDGSGSVFSYPRTKRPLLAVVVFILLSGFFYLLSFSDHIAWIFLFTLASLAAVAYLVVFVLQAKKYFHWKRSVEAYLKDLSKYEKQYLHLHAESFELVNKDLTVLEKWKCIKKVTLSSTYIRMYIETETAYTFPAKAMKSSDFETLRAFIRLKMSDVVSEP